MINDMILHFCLHPAIFYFWECRRSVPYASQFDKGKTMTFRSYRLKNTGIFLHDAENENH